ncbi:MULTISPECIES: DUF5684 domain-containing protein [unclassified Oceanispirochaeta]|uniref:DUF5684 domain-containing protein n=1 Tax=unclassified Oceanispirochaeta TaxID=2635722 RepID=UPI000E08EECF|nr:MULTISPECIES: DUF5684 domain-containing protein [unclassified Oceanispirochaeta]MBF9018015.1 signal peptidase I [Oceanispirochaeta sp. M2]NPD74527.1 signal peptidase I [Oceanispirochaeta sp. M1]RDG29639.1 signal peptidase I [Oceanispirochaeta sp. M1]
MYDSVNPVLTVFWFIVTIILVVANWKIFTKAGKPGWAILVPIYNIIVMVQIIQRPMWWVIMLFIPLVNVVFAIMIIYNLCLKFGQPGWHVVPALLLSFIYYPYLAFSNASYQG